MHPIQHTNQAKRHSIPSLQLDMASPRLIALFFAFAMAAAALHPSEAARVQVQQAFKPAAAGQKAAEKVADQAAAGGVARPSTPPAGPGIPSGLPPNLLAAILGLLFPGLGGIIGLLQPLIPLLPRPGSSSPPLQGAGKLGASLTSTSSTPQPPQPTECMTPLAGMLLCTDYLTNITVLTPPGECCDGLKSVIRDAPICLCHGMNGDMNQFLPKPVDPIRMLILPLACGTMLPLQTLFACNSQQVPPIMPPTPAEPPMTPATPPSASP
ncbi:non-specific lipid transfer protein GPI-anchored 4-like [Miscanthus floridulus]|uniref:non-specific lipid transfer protein GPI-anchored 4-like n=1 Tax=Miscanthus floridulus TaxID=154761 RepID=UPI003458D140